MNNIGSNNLLFSIKLGVFYILIALFNTVSYKCQIQEYHTPDLPQIRSNSPDRSLSSRAWTVGRNEVWMMMMLIIVLLRFCPHIPLIQRTYSLTGRANHCSFNFPIRRFASTAYFAISKYLTMFPTYV